MLYYCPKLITFISDETENLPAFEAHLHHYNHDTHAALVYFLVEIVDKFWALQNLEDLISQTSLILNFYSLSLSLSLSPLPLKTTEFCLFCTDSEIFSVSDFLSFFLLFFSELFSSVNVAAAVLDMDILSV